MRLACVVLMMATQAQAAIVGVVPFDSGAVLRLHDEPGVCVSGALRMEYVQPGKPEIPGCWIMRGQMLGLVFLDGESATIPVMRVRKPESL